MPDRAHIVDTTLFFAPRSGGVRSYLLAKHAWYAAAGVARHTLLVPGARDLFEPGGVCTLASPPIPFGAGYRLPLRLGAWRRWLTRLGPHLIEVGDPYQLAWASLAAARECDAAAVAFCHSDLPAVLGERFGIAGAAAARRYLRLRYAGFDLVIAPSTSVATRLAEAGIGPVAVQHLGVDPDVFRPLRRLPDLRARLGLPANARLLVFAGRLAREKNIPVLLETVERLGDPYWLLLVGGRRTGVRGDRTLEIPYCSRPEELAALLASADAMVHAGRNETFGLVVVEALACGTPVACFDAGALPEIVTPDIGAVAVRQDARGLVDAVASIMDRDARQLGHAARRRVLARFTWDAVFRAQLGTYAALLGRAGPVQPAVDRPALA